MYHDLVFIINLLRIWGLLEPLLHQRVEPVSLQPQRRQDLRGGNKLKPVVYQSVLSLYYDLVYIIDLLRIWGSREPLLHQRVEPVRLQHQRSQDLQKHAG